MRITVGQLRQIIREEVSVANKRRRLYELDAPPPEPAAHVYKMETPSKAEDIVRSIGAADLEDLAYANNEAKLTQEQNATKGKLVKYLTKKGVNLAEVPVIKLAEAILAAGGKTGMQLDEELKELLDRCNITYKGKRGSSYEDPSDTSLSGGAPYKLKVNW